MPNIVRHVGEPRLVCANLSCDFDGLIEVEVRWVVPESEHVEYERLKPL